MVFIQVEDLLLEVLAGSSDGDYVSFDCCIYNYNTGVAVCFKRRHYFDLKTHYAM
jgi:hypothetical protein